MGTLEAADKLLICEGFATGATLNKLTGLPVAVAFNSGNLLPVAQAFRERSPDTLIFIAGDNDHTKEQQGKSNTGLQKAREATERIGGHLLLPEFATEALGSDWNDLTQDKGVEVVRKILQIGIAIGEREHLAKSMSVLSGEPKEAILTRKPEQQNTKAFSLIR